ncbi:TonB-dependent receptor plug domain-containing protein [Fretibacter rubidus]|uniref:TonB-dependent receptor plug domain-containing protein n=1 Tax=Fretibacter rubidus TaxID=570162 RepID=UPI00352B43F0
MTFIPSFHMRTQRLLCGVALPLLLLATPAWSEDSNAVERSFEPSYFDVFQPQNASDMVSRIPGFSLSGGSGGERGFGQANLNILINGRRPSSKSSDARDILGRIPANNVLRIYIKDGASLDIPGLSGQVADIITGGSGLSGSWEYAARFEQGTQPQLLDGEISLSGSRGNLSYVASLNSGQFLFTEDGVETFADANGVVFEDRLEDIDFHETKPGVDLNLTYTPDSGHIANLNLALTYGNWNQRVSEVFTALTPRGRTGQSIFQGGEDELEYEISGDYALPLNVPTLGNGTLKLIGLHRFENSKNGDNFAELIDGQTPTRSIFNRDTDEGEYIGRAEYSFAPATDHDLQVSIEGAFNYLDRENRFEDTTTPLETDRTRVEEKRAEGNLTHSWTINPKLNLQTSIGAEYSQLNVTTDPSPARSFVRPKGFVAASYTLSPTYALRAKVERDVGQLDFGDFVDGVSLTEDIITSGNNEIVPTQFWNAEIELDRQDSAVISGTLRAFARFIEDPIDRIRFNDGSEGPGNLDSAFEYGVEANATWLLDSYGLSGMRIEAEGSLADSEIDDPLSGLARRINDTEIWSWELNYRWDIANTPYAIGGELEQRRESPFLRLDQTFDGRRDRPSSFAFIEHKDFYGFQLTLLMQNVLKERIIRPRVIFETDRLGPIAEIQDFDRRRGRRISIQISDTF